MNRAITRPRALPADIVRPFLVSLAATAVFVGIVLVCAGRLALYQVWTYAALSLALNVTQRVILASDPELAKERARPRGGSAVDKALLGLGLLSTIAMLVTAGLQLRSSLTPSLGAQWFFAGVVASLAGGFLFSWALRENRFFAAVARVQPDRRQIVCTTGPYRFVRHPGYLGMIIGTLGFPLLFQSTWSFVPAGLSVIVLLLRTHFEDVLLTRELAGYPAYRERTKFRLVPGVW